MMKTDWKNPDLQKAYKPVPEAFQRTVSRMVRSVGEKETAAPVKTDIFAFSFQKNYP